ncbi:hypothetical protein [Rubrivirga sp.]|uniref:hypothetical protein n=1 Tax=Rubrivirga sp. TaxID=1885344 RepID=UPI003B529B44
MLVRLLPVCLAALVAVPVVAQVEVETAEGLTVRLAGTVQPASPSPPRTTAQTGGSGSGSGSGASGSSRV